MEKNKKEISKQNKSMPREKKKDSVTVKANKKGKHINSFLNFLRILIIPIYWLIKPFRFYGKKKIPAGACVYVCNHFTMLDAAYVAATTWEQIHFIAKKEIEETFGLGFLARKAKAIFATRDGNDIRTLLDCFKCLKNGEKIAVFPEGTRNKENEELLPFRHGAAAMAIKAKAPVLPMVIYNRPKMFRCTHILVGDPIELTEYYDRKLTQTDYNEADEKLRSMLQTVRAEHTEYLKSRKNKKERGET